MKDFFKRIRGEVLISAVLSMALGTLLMIFTDEFQKIFCIATAVALVIAGIFYIISFFMNTPLRQLKLGAGTVLAIVGVWFLISPDTLWKIVSVVVGAVLLIHGIQDVKLAIDSKKYMAPKWWLSLIFGVLNIVLAAVCIAHMFSPIKFIIYLMGIALIYDGITDIFIVIKVNSAAKNMRAQTRVVDMDAKIDDID